MVTCVRLQGFIVNRMLMPMLNEAFFALMEVRPRAPCNSKQPLTTCASEGMQHLRVCSPVCVELLPGSTAPYLIEDAMIVLAMKLVSTHICMASHAWHLNCHGCHAQGVATVEDIDCAMELGASHNKGPLKTADYIGALVC
jgi:3-hydroxyacyl-CoA dehydrogenase, C-terminal domain